MRRLTYRLVAVLTFAVGLCASALWFELLPAYFGKTTAEPPKVVGLLAPAQVVSYMLTTDESPVTTDQYMIVAQPRENLSITEPLAARPADASLIEYSCGTLVISVDANRRLSLNSKELGTLDHPEELIAMLRDVFRERTKMTANWQDIEAPFTAPDESRSYKTVLILPSSSVSYADVVKLIELVKETGASPIALKVADD
ncbi:MAG TPA: hypothetical protein VGC89_21520 [Pyrinomonadaceae bacterium]